MKGNYQSAKMNYGNKISDHIQSQKQVINIETMTLRVWMAEVETVAYGKDAARSILSMRRLKDESRLLHDHLSKFGQQQSMIVAPTSSVDLQRTQALRAMSQVGGGAGDVQQVAGIFAEAIQKGNTPQSGQQVVPPPFKPFTCPQCHKVTEVGMKFSSDCGTRLATT